MLSIRHQIVVNMPYKLVHFLIKNNCYSQFINNLIDYRVIWGNTSLHEILWKLQSVRAIDTSFIWHRTPEGQKYWEDLHYKYYEQEYEQKTECCKVS